MLVQSYHFVVRQVVTGKLAIVLLRPGHGVRLVWPILVLAAWRASHPDVWLAHDAGDFRGPPAAHYSACGRGRNASAGFAPEIQDGGNAEAPAEFQTR